MDKRTPRPSRLLIIAIVYTTAIGTARLAALPKCILFVFTVISLLALWPLYRAKRPAAALLAGFFFLGMLMAEVSREPYPEDLCCYTNQRISVTGRVVSIPQKGGKNSRFILQAESIFLKGRRIHVTGKTMVLVPGNPPDFGDQVRLFGNLKTPDPPNNPGQFSYKEYLANQRIFSVLILRSSRNVHPVRNTPGINLYHAASWMRNQIMSVLRQCLPEDEIPIIGSMVFGMQAADVPPETIRDFRYSGTIHLLVVSGSQVMALVLVLFWLTKRLRIHPVLSAAFIFLAVFFYSLMTGLGDSVLRAAIVGVLTALGVSLSRESDPWTLLSAAALIILALNPLALFDVGFQLSFAAVIGILAFTGPVYHWIYKTSPKSQGSISKILSQIALLIAVSFSAQLTTSPLIAWHFQEFTPMGVISNLVAVPLAAMLTPLGLATFLMGFLWNSLGKVMGLIDSLIIKFLAGWVSVMAHLPNSHYILPQIFMGWLILWYAMLFLIAWHPKWMTRERWIILSAGILMILFSGWSFSTSKQNSMKAAFLSVKDKNITLIKTPSGRGLLIDATCYQEQNESTPSDSDNYVQNILIPAMKAWGLSGLDLVILPDVTSNSMRTLRSISDSVSVREIRVLMDSKDGYLSVFTNKTSSKVLFPSQSLQFKDGICLTLLKAKPTVIQIHYGKKNLTCCGKLGKSKMEEILGEQSTHCPDVIRLESGNLIGENQDCLYTGLKPAVAVFNTQEQSGMQESLRKHGTRVYTLRQNGAVLIETDGICSNSHSIK